MKYIVPFYSLFVLVPLRVQIIYNQGANIASVPAI